MVDPATKRRMQAVPRAHTMPEMRVRRLAHALGYRFRLHRTDLPGSPDLVFPKHHTVVFVHGCFWHGHDCKRGMLPKTNRAYWAKKIEKNRSRDRQALDELSRKRQLRTIRSALSSVPLTAAWLVSPSSGGSHVADPIFHHERRLQRPA